MSKSVFISSTSKDLPAHRAKVDEALRGLELRPINMQDFGSQPGGAAGVSLREVGKADLFICIIARRYGYVPPNASKSVTEQEYDEAVKRGIPRLMYLVNPAHDWEWQGKGEEDDVAQEKLAAFRARVERQDVRSLFTTPDDLARQVTADVTKWLDKGRQVQVITSALLAFVAVFSLIALVLLADPGLRSDVIEIVGLASATPMPAPTIAPTPLEGIPFAQNVVGVVLADFTNVDTSDRAIERRIERAFEEQGVNFIRVHHPLRDREHAREIADLYNATVTIFGESQAEGVEVFYNITPRRSQVETPVSSVSVAADLNNFSTYIFDGIDALYVVDFVRGQLAYFEKRFGEALQFFEAALGRLPAQRRQELGAAALYYYAARSLQDNTTELNPRPRLEQAIQYYQDSLRFLEPAQSDEQFAYVNTQNNLGAAYQALAPHSDDPAGMLGQAIIAYEEVLGFFTPTAAPVDYATTQNNLGTAYADLAPYTDDPASVLREAITAYEEALHFHTPDVTPLDYAMTHNNLGNAYGSLAPYTDNPVSVLEEAIAAYEEALRFFTPTATPLNYAGTHYNLGAAYQSLAAHSDDPAKVLGQAITAYEEALRFQTPTVAPLNYAATQNNLGTAYLALVPYSDDPAEVLKDAIAAFEEALRFRMPTAVPLDYAQTIVNLGAAQHIGGDEQNACANWREAVGIYQQSGIQSQVTTIQNGIDQFCAAP